LKTGQDVGAGEKRERGTMMGREGEPESALRGGPANRGEKQKAGVRLFLPPTSDDAEE